MIHDHFLAAADIWRAFSAGQISSARRDALLAPLRAALALLPSSR